MLKRKIMCLSLARLRHTLGRKLLNGGKFRIDSSFDLHDVIHMVENTIISPKLVKFLDLVVQTTIWIIWKFKNNMVLSKQHPSKNLLLNDIKLMSYTWISSRYRKACLNWQDQVAPRELMFGSCKDFNKKFYNSLGMDIKEMDIIKAKTDKAEHEKERVHKRREFVSKRSIKVNNGQPTK
ncbi:hypothetical protein Tco_1232080 [Tanacetum coccineum]